MKPSILFISYSHDSEAHREDVLSLSERLRGDGYDTRFDQYVNGTPAEKWPRWMLDRLDEASFVLVVCTETYYRRFRGHDPPGKGKGVDWEGALITQEIYDARSRTQKFVPVLLAAGNDKFIPEPLRGQSYFTLDSEASYQALCDYLDGVAGVEPRPVGVRKRKARRRGTPLAFDRADDAHDADNVGDAVHRPSHDARARDSNTTIGEFELRGCMGSGGMGIVYRAWQASAEREVALKCLHLVDAAARERFQTEIRALGKVAHPNLVRLYTSGTHAQQSYFAMELVDGTTFKELYRQLRRSDAGRLDDDCWATAVSKASDETRSRELALGDTVAEPAGESRSDSLDPYDYLDFAPGGEACESEFYIRRIATIVHQITTVTQALHDKGIIHRDIKPENIMVARNGNRAVLIDLGIAKITLADDTSLTRTGDRLYTLRYASPEQILDARAVDHRTDIYSLGVTLWELLTLRPIYGIVNTDQDFQSKQKIQHDEPKPVRKYNRAVPTDLQAIVQKCLEKKPDNRYQTADELADDLTRFLDGQPVQARPVGPLARSWRKCRRRPLVPLLLIALALIIAVPASWWYATRPDPNVVRVGIKQWVGYAPLVVADELGLFGDVHLEFITIDSIEHATTLLDQQEIDVGMWLVDWQVLAMSKNVQAKVVLMLDESLEADAIVARDSIQDVSDLKGKPVAYQKDEPSEYLLRRLCQKTVGTSRECKFEDLHSVNVHPETAKEDFIAGKYEAVGTYAPHVYVARQSVPGAHLLYSGADEPGIIVDILTVRTDYLDSRPDKVKALIEGWLKAVEILQSPAHDSYERAMLTARRFNGTPPPGTDWSARNLEQNTPCSPQEYREMTTADQMRWGDRSANREFFRPRNGGSSRYQDLFLAARERFKDDIRKKPLPAEGDGSAHFRDVYGW